MPIPTINQGGANPSRDGELNLYISPEGQRQNWFNRSRRVVFVNGMANTPADHATSARALSLLQGCPVVGVYNRTDGFWIDIGQCLMDKITLMPAQAHSFEGWQFAIDAAYATARGRNRGLSKVDFVGRLVADNRATHQLYHYVAGISQAQRGALKIYSHSQGNLVTSNALTAVALAHGIASISGLEVNSFGSPCRFWPRGLNRTNYAFTFDPVSWMDYRFGFDNVKIGFVGAHGFQIYMQHDAEFVVNRFRWGSFGMTASMDESGLADFLIRIGNNPPRVKAVFQRLIDAHWSDSDDVAEIYVRRARQRQPNLLPSLARADADLIRLMIRCLDEGPTMPGEYEQMGYLQRLI